MDPTLDLEAGKQPYLKANVLTMWAPIPPLSGGSIVAGAAAQLCPASDSAYARRWPPSIVGKIAVLQPCLPAGGPASATGPGLPAGVRPLTCCINLSKPPNP